MPCCLLCFAGLLRLNFFLPLVQLFIDCPLARTDIGLDSVLKMRRVSKLRSSLRTLTMSFANKSQVQSSRLML